MPDGHCQTQDQAQACSLKNWDRWNSERAFSKKARLGQNTTPFPSGNHLQKSLWTNRAWSSHSVPARSSGIAEIQGMWGQRRATRISLASSVCTWQRTDWRRENGRKAYRRAWGQADTAWTQSCKGGVSLGPPCLLTTCSSCTLMRRDVWWPFIPQPSWTTPQTTGAGGAGLPLGQTWLQACQAALVGQSWSSCPSWE